MSPGYFNITKIRVRSFSRFLSLEYIRTSLIHSVKVDFARNVSSSIKPNGWQQDRRKTDISEFGSNQKLWPEIRFKISVPPRHINRLTLCFLIRSEGSLERKSKRRWFSNHFWMQISVFVCFYMLTKGHLSNCQLLVTWWVCLIRKSASSFLCKYTGANSFSSPKKHRYIVLARYSIISTWVRLKIFMYVIGKWDWYILFSLLLPASWYILSVTWPPDPHSASCFSGKKKF